MKKIIYLLILTAFVCPGSKAQLAGKSQKINLTSFTVYAKDTKIVIDWSTDGTAATNYWEIQRSADGIQFQTIALVLGPDPRESGDRYQYLEKVKDSKSISTYYRLKHIDADGKEFTSEMVQPVK